jgi:dTDP-4-dehydrorhamnose reductase
VTAAGPPAGLRPVVLGAEGRAGSALAAALAVRCPQTVAAGKLELDITDSFRLGWELERLEADLVINAAGWADVDACEADPERAMRVNAVAAGEVARVARTCGARLVHLSSDHVFDGEKGAPYGEDDATAPVSAYGRSKRTGELLVLEHHPEALIVRTAWLFGGHGPRRDFPERILEQAAAGAVIQVVRDQVGSPTSAAELARGVLELLAVDARGLVHLVCTGGVSRADFALAVLDEAGRPDVEIEPVPGRLLPGQAPRPADARLDTSRYRELTGGTPLSWREALAEVMAERRTGGGA